MKKECQDLRLRHNLRPPHLGVILREHYLVPRKIQQKHFANDVKVNEKHLSRIINGHARIDAPLTARIAKTLGTTTPTLRHRLTCGTTNRLNPTASRKQCISQSGQRV